MLKFHELTIKPFLKTEKVKSKLHKAQGLILHHDGITKLVDIYLIPKTGNEMLDTFLGLPNEALAELKCEIK